MWGEKVNDYINERVIVLSKYIVESEDTVRGAAYRFGISKSTVHKDITVKLSNIDKSLYKQVRKVLETNKSLRHIRGGTATKEKYSIAKGTQKSNT